MELLLILLLFAYENVTIRMCIFRLIGQIIIIEEQNFRRWHIIMNKMIDYGNTNMTPRSIDTDAMEVVLIRYGNKDRLLFDVMAEFFKMMGIFVVGVNSSSQNEDNFIKKQKNLSVSLEFNLEKAHDGFATVANIVDSVLTYLQEQNLIKNREFIEASEYLSKLNSKFELLKHAITLQCYKSSSRKKSAMTQVYRQIKNDFMSASDFIVQNVDSESFENNRFLRYLQICCKQKAYLATKYENAATNNNILRYDILDMLGSDTMNLISDFPDFVAAWVLLGKIYDLHVRYNNEVVDAYSRALRAIGKQVYSSSIYYLLAKKYETYFGLDDDVCSKFYQLAKDLRPDYRNIYKIAAIAMNRKDWKCAIKIFNNCLQALKEKSNFLNPLELEYYYKVCMHISYCYLKLQDYSNIIKFAKMGLKLKEDIGNGIYDKYFQALYGSERFKDYIQAVLCQMNEKSAFRYLSEAYMLAGVEEWSIEYLDKANGD